MKNKMKQFGFLSALLVMASSSKAAENVINLTGGAPASGTANGAIFDAADPRPTGTGFIDPFLREQNDGSETGVNTSISSPPYDDKAGNWTHDEAVSSLAQITVGSTKYYEFGLDVNQSHNGPISLTSLQIFVSGTEYTTASALMTEVTTATPGFDMNASAPNTRGTPGSVRVDIPSDTGSGSGDMFVLVPVSDIGTSGWLYLDAEFSGDLSGVSANGAGYPSNDGFEEWWAITANIPAAVPDGGTTVMLLGAALASLGLVRRKLAH